MGLTCRLLGHSYGDPETERERQENGDEVVVSIRELQVCSRCGHEQVISENKEVTAIRTPEEVGMTEGEVETAAAGFEPAEPEPGVPEDDPAIETAPDPATEAEAEAEAEAAAASSADGEPVDDEADELEEPPVTDDAVILDDDEEDGADRDRTQWPDEVDEMDTDDPVPDHGDDGNDAEFIDAEAETDAADADAAPTRERGAWPAHPGEDEGWDAEPDDGEPASVTFGGGLTPEADTAARAETNGEYVEAGRGDDEFVRAGEASIGSDAPDEAVEYYCPNCGHSRGASASSMRAGDICPECRKGYIAERSR